MAESVGWIKWTKYSIFGSYIGDLRKIPKNSWDTIEQGGQYTFESTEVKRSIKYIITETLVGNEWNQKNWYKHLDS